MHCPLLILFILAASIPLSVFSLGFPSITQMKKIFLVEYSGNCDGKMYPVSHINYSFVRNGSYTLVSGKPIVLQDLGIPLPAELNITRCEDRSDLSTCRLQNTFKWKDACQFMGNRYMPLVKMFVESLEPPIAQCPIKKGTYHFRNVKVSTNLITAVLAGDYRSRALWTVRLAFWQDHQIVSCYQAAVRIAYVRNRL